MSPHALDIGPLRVAPKRCMCNAALTWHAASASWACPYLTAPWGERDPGERIVGLLKPLESAICRRNVVARTLAEAHVTCLPGELFDETLEVTAAHRYARGLGMGDPSSPAKRNGRRAIVDDRGVPLSTFGQAFFDTYECSDCGFRTPSAEYAKRHLFSHGHDNMENKRGDRVDRADR